MKLPNYAAHGAPKGEAVLETLQNDRYFIGLRVPRPSVGEGQLDLLLDTSPLLTGAAAGCGPGGTSPDGADRRFEIVFDAALGSPASIVQWQGACSVSEPWELVASGAEWLVEAIAAAPPDDPQFMHVEMTLAPPLAETLSSLGLGMMWTSPGAVLQIPRAESAPPNVSDASSWDLVAAGPPSGLNSVHGLVVDGMPARSRSD